MPSKYRGTVYVPGKGRTDVYAATKKELEGKRREKLKKTFGDAVEEWLEAVVEPAHTLSAYRNIERRIHKFSSLGKTPVEDVAFLDLQRVMNGLGLSQDYASHARSAVRQLFEYCEAQGYVDRNPAAKLAARGKPEVPRQPITEEQAEAILSTPHRVRLAAMLGMLAGLRRGEALALNWEDVGEGFISVSKAVAFERNQPVLKAPKTKSGVRSVYILPQLAEALEQERGEGPIVKSASGEPMTAIAWRRAWASYLKALGTDFTFHQLRHYYASMLYKAGVDPKTMANQLGHAKADISVNRYSTIDLGFVQNQMSAIGQKPT